MLKLAAPEMVMNRLPKVAAQIFDFVSSEVTQRAPGHWQAVIYGVPDRLLGPYQALTTVFIATILGLTGAKGVENRWLPPKADGEKHGFKILRLEREIRWSA
jgi:hypothetical protein